MPIASIGVVLTVTPRDELQIMLGEGNHEFTDDRTPFKLRVAEVLRENGAIIGVAGTVFDGHPRYLGKVAILVTRVTNSNWEVDLHSGVNFKVGATVARRIPEFPHWHPEGTEVEGYPVIIRYGSVDAEA